MHYVPISSSVRGRRRHTHRARHRWRARRGAWRRRRGVPGAEDLLGGGGGGGAVRGLARPDRLVVAGGGGRRWLQPPGHVDRWWGWRRRRVRARGPGPRRRGRRYRRAVGPGARSCRRRRTRRGPVGRPTAAVHPGRIVMAATAAPEATPRRSNRPAAGSAAASVTSVEAAVPVAAHFPSSRARELRVRAERGFELRHHRRAPARVHHRAGAGDGLITLTTTAGTCPTPPPPDPGGGSAVPEPLDHAAVHRLATTRRPAAGRSRSPAVGSASRARRRARCAGPMCSAAKRWKCSCDSHTMNMIQPPSVGPAARYVRPSARSNASPISPVTARYCSSVPPG